MKIIEPADVRKTGDDTPAPGLWGYVRRMSGWRQAGLFILALLGTMLNLLPIELQRRIIDDAIVAGDAAQLWTLGAAYAVAIVALQGVKFSLQTGQAWLGESAILYTRRHLMRLYAAGTAGRNAQPGEATSIIGAEVEKLGGFVGTGPSQAFSDASLLLGVLIYMTVVDPGVAAIGIALILPQILLTPLLQRRINRLTRRQLSLSRGFGATVAALRESEAATAEHLATRLFRNRMMIAVCKAIMKALLNLLNGAAPLAMLMAGGWMAIEGQTTVGVLVAFISGFQRVGEPIRNLIAFYRQAETARVQHGMIARWM
jgi:ABC-type bacteriocin/lantibiotic exporter with double-glycine peptidase domain